MPINYIVTQKNGKKITFDANQSTGVEDFDAMVLGVELAVYVCLTMNSIDADDARNVTTKADWENTFCKEHGPLPSDFTGEFSYAGSKTLGKKFVGKFDKKKLLSMLNIYEIRYL